MKSIPLRIPYEGSFDCLRLLAASVVLFSHCYFLLGKESAEPLLRAVPELTLGTVAVYAFFAISGYLVMQSWLRDPSVSRFMLRRGLRIFPALAFVIVASVFVIGPLTTNLSPADYFSRRAAWSYLAKVLIYPTQHGLPGVFGDNALPNVVNGALWTLRLEFGLYAVVAALGRCGFLRFKGTGALLAAASLAVYAAFSPVLVYPAQQPIPTFFANATPFFVGMALAQNNIDSKAIRALTFMLILLSGFLFGTAAFPPLLLVSLPCAVLLLGHDVNCSLGKVGDYSYGLYLWGFPMEQTLLHFSGPVTVGQLFPRAAIATLLAAVISWHLIETHALRLKPRTRKRAKSRCAASQFRENCTSNDA